MRVLAIDTALEACSAAVLDTDGKASSRARSLTMVRGHAEALMPLIARVMDERRRRIRRARPHRGHDRPRQLHRAARRHFGRARHCAGGRQAGDRPHDARRLRGAPTSPRTTRSPVVAAIDARHDHVYLQVFGAGGRTLVAPRIASLREAVRHAADGQSRIVGSAAALIAAAWPTSEPPPAHGRAAQRARHRLGRAARRARPTSDPAPPKPLYLRAPDAQPQDAARLPRR